MKHELNVINDNDSRRLATTPRVPLTKLSHIRDELARVYRHARSGKLEIQEATRLTYILTSLAKVIEAGDIEARIDALEQGTQKKRGPAVNGGIKRRLQQLEMRAGKTHPGTVAVQVNSENYLEKQREIEAVQRAGHFVIVLIDVGIDDETEHPDFFNWRKKRRG